MAIFFGNILNPQKSIPRIERVVCTAPRRAFYWHASLEALNILSLASSALPPVNGQFTRLTTISANPPACLLETRFARYPPAKAFLRDTSTGKAGGFHNNEKRPPNYGGYRFQKRSYSLPQRHLIRLFLIAQNRKLQLAKRCNSLLQLAPWLYKQPCFSVVLALTQHPVNHTVPA